MIGDGKGNIELETSNGSILLKSRDTRRSSWELMKVKKIIGE
jgi:hypothetical protein